MMKTEHEYAMACGLTKAEAECWEIVAKLAVKLSELPSLHPTTGDELGSAIHTIQDKLLARPVYRKYLELTAGVNITEY